MIFSNTNRDLIRTYLKIHDDLSPVVNGKAFANVKVYEASRDLHDAIERYLVHSLPPDIEWFSKENAAATKAAK